MSPAERALGLGKALAELREKEPGIFRAMLANLGSRDRQMCDILAERERQDQQWGGSRTDDNRSAMDFRGYIHKQTNALQAAHAVGNRAEQRQRLVKIAALALAAIESHDRVDAAGPQPWGADKPAGPEEECECIVCEGARLALLARAANPVPDRETIRQQARRAEQTLRGVLTDPVAGIVVIEGSDGDRQEVAKALDLLGAILRGNIGKPG